jgi:hypothetical protein
MTPCTSVRAKEPAASVNRGEAHWIKKILYSKSQNPITLFLNYYTSYSLKTGIILYKLALFFTNWHYSLQISIIL